MMLSSLFSPALDLSEHRPGRPQVGGPLTMLPLFGPAASSGRFSSPLTGLKLAGVRGYGNVELNNPSPRGVAIVPLHIGYIQDGAQNHALCRSAFLAGGQSLLIEDACCVQQAQGGFLEAREQWFFILPLQLRAEALRLRGQKSYGKLWQAIAALNARLGLPDRGHLEQVLCGQRAQLTQYQSRLELMPGQTGALFFLRGRLVGLELAPDAGYFQEVWMPLVCFCYGVAAWEQEQRDAGRNGQAEPLGAGSLDELRQRLAQGRDEVRERVRRMVEAVSRDRLERQEEERFLGLRLYTALGDRLAGQYVEEDGRLVYASLAATPRHLNA